MALTKLNRRLKLKQRIRKTIIGTSEIPRLCVFRSNREIYVQIIDDGEMKTLASASSKNKEISEKGKVKKIEQADFVGKLIAEKALSLGIEKVVFDRNGYLYHGRVKTLADAARKAGLKF